MIRDQFSTFLFLSNKSNSTNESGYAERFVPLRVETIWRTRFKVPRACNDRLSISGSIDDDAARSFNRFTNRFHVSFYSRSIGGWAEDWETRRILSDIDNN